LKRCKDFPRISKPGDFYLRRLAMKLLYCKKCGNIFNLILYEEKSCECGSTKGKYGAITFQPEEDIPEGSGGRPMTWYVVPKKCKTFRRTA